MKFNFTIAFSELVSKGFNFLTILILIKIVSAENYGVYSYAISIASVAIIFSDLGFSWYAFNDSLNTKSNIVLNKIISFKAIFSSVVVFLAPLIFVRTYELFILFFLVLASLSITSFNRNILMIHRAKMNIFEDNILILFEPTLRLALMVVLWSFFNDVSISIICMGFLGIGVLSLSINYLISSKLLLKFQTLNRREIIELLKKTSPFFFYYLFHVSIVRIDIIFLEKFANYQSVAQYSASFTILLTIVMVFNAAMSSNFLKSIKLTFFKVGQFILLASIPTIICTRLFSADIFGLLFPEAYSSSSQIINNLILSIPFTTATFWFTIRNNFLKRQNINVVVYFISFVLKLAFLLYYKPNDPLIFSKLYIGFEVITLILMLVIVKFKK